MKTLLIALAIWLSASIQVSGQRAPVRFVPIDSISTIPSGQKVKLDFKTNEQSAGRYPRAYPSLRGARPIPEVQCGLAIQWIFLLINKGFNSLNIKARLWTGTYSWPKDLNRGPIRQDMYW